MFAAMIYGAIVGAIYRPNRPSAAGQVK
jgi:hypothetical protein